MTMHYSGLGYLVILITCLNITYGIIFPLEGESALPAPADERNRTNASSGRTIHITSGREITLKFCLRRRSYVSVFNIVYSNDGASDTVSVWLDHTSLGRFSTKARTNFGLYWDKMFSTGPVGKRIPFPSGEHLVILRVESADEYGVEIDKVDISVSDPEITEWYFNCVIQCFDNQATNVISNDEIIPARFEQWSRATECAEEDNVKIAVFHQTAERFRITASLPSYESITNLNNRQTDFSGCDIIGSTIWQIGKDDGLSEDVLGYNFLDANWSYGATGQSQNLPPVIRFVSGKEMSFDIKFHIKGESIGINTESVGSVLTVKLTEVRDVELELGLVYRGRTNRFSSAGYRRFSAVNTLQNWLIPDYTWSESSENTIRLICREAHSLKNMSRYQYFKMRNLHFDFIRLDRREEKGEKVFPVYSSKDVFIEGIEVDFWWLSPKTITIRRSDTGDTWPKVDYFRVYVRVPYTTSLAQIFVMYQDGNVRLLPLPPPTLDWIPFGSSVIIGQSDPVAFRPHADIKFVDLDPEKLTMKLGYNDGGSVTVRLTNKVYETILHVEQATYTRDLAKYPFIMLRSMWVDDGNSDVEKVTSPNDAPTTRHILGNWKPFYAASVIFHRSCISRHNTLSPDIRLDMLP